LHCNFGHLDGYSAIYYTYMWSLVIAKDMFSLFEEAGLMDREVARRYRRTILEPGGTKPAAQLVRDFLGRDYSFDAFAKWLSGG
ncbi:MAG: peptidase M3, partial [Candidatus Marinimicrobia bacterium]|nr:peptidase M3 [Candidatus Neomarinimicrobiota bacterium]